MLRIVIVLILLGARTASAVVVASEDFHRFEGAGLAPGGDDGRLDSMRWAVLGLSDGDAAFGAVSSAGDLARGRAVRPVRAGGLYAFSLPDDVTGAGVQATSSDFTPGALVWRTRNDGDDTWRDLRIAFDFWYRNDGARATELNVHAALDGDSPLWQHIDAATRLTPALADGTSWRVERISAALTALDVPPLESLLLRFTLDDASSVGTRDEVALARLELDALAEVEALSAPASALLVVSLLGAIGVRWRVPNRDGRVSRRPHRGHLCPPY